ncbi:hypothetical protein HHK36_021071 [Tetracentron sinense]|uniref:Cation-transporting P-type ATPase C-terminal domain-containing protein n=1 Tax=Tetracentron sinense TaxID=13715 RepID=A0A834YQV1_TETSI|nr:hypothetical protein HHK36_021071 [Tetracentron sinense]
MVTGDNLHTAKAIALECGILGSDVDATEPNLIEGRAFRALSDIEREQVAGQILVMGRSSPNDKLLLVQALRRKGNVVAVTGDGTNDAPALHEADIGLSMGIQGTEVAKESSDIIILDDNFASVVKLLWVNLIMDTLGALALATEPPTDHLMHRPPVGRRRSAVESVPLKNEMGPTVMSSNVKSDEHGLCFCYPSTACIQRERIVENGNAHVVLNDDSRACFVGVRVPRAIKVDLKPTRWREGPNREWRGGITNRRMFPEVLDSSQFTD